MGCPIRKSRDQRIFAPTPGLSQLITSFIASVSQGIRHAPFVTFANDCKQRNPRLPCPTDLRPLDNYSIRILCPTDLRPLDNYLLSLILSAVDSYNLIYSLACVNMSKNSSRQTPSLVSGLGLTDAYALVILFSGWWRITDSNR